MDTTNWRYLYKLDYKFKNDVTTNMLYTPLVSPEGNILCMIYDESHEYQHESTGITKELVDFFFEREVKYLQRFQEYEWAPRILEVDLENRRVFIEFNNETINHVILTDGRSLDNECPDWKEQIFTIVKDIDDAGYYKMALYPHCFFIVDGKIKTIDFYSCLEKDNRFLERSKIAGIIGEQSTGRFDDATVGEMIDFGIFFEKTMLEHLAQRWPDNPFPDYYKRINNV